MDILKIFFRDGDFKFCLIFIGLIMCADASATSLINAHVTSFWIDAKTGAVRLNLAEFPVEASDGDTCEAADIDGRFKFYTQSARGKDLLVKIMIARITNGGVIDVTYAPVANCVSANAAFLWLTDDIIDLDNDGFIDVIDNCYSVANEFQQDSDGDEKGTACDAFPNDPLEWQDIDTDGTGDNEDNCPSLSNSNQINSDSDTYGNVCDTDDDNDLMSDVWETQYGLNPLVNDASADMDNDDLTNLREYYNGSNPSIARTKKNDYNNDGIAGWIWLGVSNGHETESQIWQLGFPFVNPNYSIPDRSFLPMFDDQANWEIMTSGDFNKDGDADILWRHHTLATWKVWQIQNGLRDAQNDLADFDVDHAWQVIGAGDTDKDGDDDIILNKASTGDVMIWEMQDHAIVTTYNVGTKSGYALNRIGDFNKDGDVDLLFRENGSDVLVTWEIEQNALLQERALANTGPGYNPVCAADFDNDGDDDIMFINTSTTQEKWFVMENYMRTQSVGGTNIGFVFFGCADYDGDGDADMLWQRSSDDKNRVVLQQDFGAGKLTVYTNIFGGVNGFVYRGNSN